MSNVKTKECSGCKKQIYWNVSQNKYYEVETAAQHNCPNRESFLKPKPSNNYALYSKPQSQWAKAPQQEKPIMSNTFEFLQGSPRQVREQYQYLSDTISSLKGKVHGSQSHVNFTNGTLNMFIYFEIPVGQRETVQRDFEAFVSRRKNES